MGFIGSNYILNRMQKHDDFIYNIDSLTYASNPWYLERIKGSGNYRFINDDINNISIHGEELSDLDAIVNFAAESHVDNSIKDSSSFIRSNIMGTHALLEFARRNDLRFHQISTDEVYGALPLDSREKFNVDSPYNPKNPYSATKASADMLVRSYCNTYGLKATISNCSNNFGPHQHREKLIPKTILNLMNNERVPIYGDGKQIRDWIYVTDHCNGIDLILEKGMMGKTYLIGSDGEHSNIEVVREIIKLMKKGSDMIRHVEDRPGHDKRYAIDASSIRKLGWKSEFNFDDALRQTVEHYVKNYENYIL
ncbi:MAG: dTDP-glucose 4,6-dehydratase [Candidatus Thermoplasmatota archaeon]|nr:dTDP-glucose 4,6-dehydratase [Candidatus Thermoplasmatota archaeon]